MDGDVVSDRTVADRSGVVDDYAVAAEYYDVWARSYWDELAPRLRRALSGIDPGAGAVVELGAGTGLGTLVVADTVPDVPVMAVEPSRAMRAPLAAKLIARPDLHSRVTLMPVDLAHLVWPERLSGFVALAVLGHLTPGERVGLWGQLGTRLARGAPAIVHLQPPARPEYVALQRYATARLGDLDYEGWSRAEPAGERALRWTMTYRVLRGGEVVDEQHWASTFQTVALDDVVVEAAAAGLVTEGDDAGLVVLRRPK